MSNWLLDLFTAPAKLAQARRELADNAVLLQMSRDNSAVCQTEKDTYYSAIKQLEKINRELDARNASLLIEIQALKDSMGGTEADLAIALQSINELTEDYKFLQAQLEEARTKIAELQAKLADFESGITPEKLKSFLIAKYGLHAEEPKLWDDYDKVLFEVFGAEQPALVEVIAEDFKERILKAFPGIQFHSPAKDSLYYLPTEEWAFKALVHDFGDLMPYVPEKKDCDAFAQALRSHFTTQYGTKSVIELWGYWATVYHSWNAIICSNGVLEIEPQTDQVYEAGFLSDHKADAIHDW